MDRYDRTTKVARERVRAGAVHVRLLHPGPAEGEVDESLFFLIALLAGAVCGYLVAIA
jgi:hypothetical protein